MDFHALSREFTPCENFVERQSSITNTPYINSVLTILGMRYTIEKPTMTIPKRALSPQLINKAKSVFINNGWSLSDQQKFDRFCATLAILSKKQQDLYLELTQNFLVYENVSSYRTGILNTFSNLDTSSIEKIFIYPLLAEEDLNKNKSSLFVHYQFKDARFDLPDDVDDKLVFHDRPGEGLPQNLNEKHKIVLVDDFIGTAGTALSAVAYLCKKKNVDKNKIIILSLVAQQQGLDILRNEGLVVFAHIIRNKGISDNYSQKTKTNHLATMKKIEDILSVQPNYQFGYGHSEALVKVVRTPNNTFPVYWIIKDSIQFKGIFPRRR
jgi:hypothetical protein